MSFKTANIIAWILQVLLSIMFIMSGAMKVFSPISELAVSMPWIGDFPESIVRFIGVAELLGGIGLILPGLIKYKPQLTAYAAIGILLIMLGAIVVHVLRGETNVVGINIIIAVLAVLVAWLRLKKAPIHSKL